MRKRARRRWKAAAIQMTSTGDRDHNLALAEKLVREAARQGAALIALPENFSYLHSAGGFVPHRDPIRGRLVTWLRGLARDVKAYLLAGSIPEEKARSRRVYNTSLLFDPEGHLAAKYRKIHLFDVDIPGKITLKESKTIASGDDLVLAHTPLGNLGLTICYDLRFPELYRGLTRRGAHVLLVPAAFTSQTGPKHWLPLLRARAIENQCYVVAPDQFGRHGAGRSSHGQSVIINPMGKVIAEKKKGMGVVTAEIDLDYLEKIRTGLPTLEHVRRDLF